MVPGGRFELFLDAGHMLILEEPDRVAAAILRLAGDPIGEDMVEGTAGAAGEDPVDGADEVSVRSGAD